MPRHVSWNEVISIIWKVILRHSLRSHWGNQCAALHSEWEGVVTNQRALGYFHELQEKKKEPSQRQVNSFESSQNTCLIAPYKANGQQQNAESNNV